MLKKRFRVPLCTFLLFCPLCTGLFEKVILSGPYFRFHIVSVKKSFSLSLVAKRSAEKSISVVFFFVLFSFFVPYVPGPLQEAIWNLMGRSETFASSWPC